MVVQFCGDCGNLLDDIAVEDLRCELCGRTAKNATLNRTATSASENFPSRLRTKLKSYTQSVTKKDGEGGPRMEMDCIKCPSKVVTYVQLQLRSADEGTTLFYTCLKCGQKWKEDN